MDDFIDFCKQLKIRPGISFTGGDPFIERRFFELLDEAKKRNIRINILGNSFLLDEKTVLRLKNYNLSYYQLSLDGMKQKHDFLRKEGSFEDITRAIKLLKNMG